MKKIVIAVLVVVLGGFLAWAGSHGGATVGSVSALGLLVALAFLVQWVGFLYSWRAQTERYFDLTGSLTYIGLTVVALLVGGPRDARTWLLAAMVIVWAARLGTYLFRRIRSSGSDDRFAEILPDTPRLFLVWTIQGLWVTFTALAAWTAMTTTPGRPLGWLSLLGGLLWLGGFVLEVTADAQKSAFRRNPPNKGEFIRTGVWSRSRHPNYFGEIVTWTGVFLVAAPVLHGWQWVALVSPVFVTVLLTRVSGIPMLEKKADRRWGDRADYREYKRTTPVLIPSVRG